mmetsp:Transcript_4623/g.13994  ORF Transcript_4623/g.13994 Transcript_4623/m.13994 type:complete len:91 (-) Transcript_4623:1223-1495(-)
MPLLKSRCNSHACRNIIQLCDVVPCSRIYPLRTRIRSLIMAIDHHTTMAKEVKFLRWDLIFTGHDTQAKLQRKQEFVSLKKASTCVLVDR